MTTLNSALDIAYTLDRAIKCINSDNSNLEGYDGKELVLDGALSGIDYDDNYLYVGYVAAYTLFQYGNLETVVCSEVAEFINAYATGADEVRFLSDENKLCEAITPYLSSSSLSYDSLMKEVYPTI